MRLSPPLVLVVLLSLLAGCRRGADEGGSSAVAPAVVRIADRLAEAEVSAAVDLSDDRASLLADASILVDAPLSGDRPARSSHDGAWVDELHPGRGPLLLHWAPVEPSQRALHVRVDGRFEPDDAAFLIPVPQRNEAGAYRDPAHAEKIVRYLHALAIPLAPRAGSEDPSRELVTTLAPDVREVLVAVRGAATDDPSAKLLVAALGPRGAWLGRAARDVRSPWIRSVAVDQVTRPSIVLPSPARVDVPVRVPSGAAPRLRFHAARFFGAEGDVTLAFALRVGGVTVAGQERLPRAGGLREVEVDLERVGLGDGRFTLEVEGAPGAIVAIAAPRIESRPEARAPDVLLISLDTVRADHLSIHGAPAENSPSLARFADSAAVFDQAIAPAPWTLPSHASLFTGQQPDRHDVHRELSAVPRDLPWLVEDFRRAGYRTEAWTGGGYLDPTFGFDRGFDRYGTTDPAFPGRAWAARRGDAAEIRRAEASARSRRELLERIAAPSDVPTFRFVHTYAAHEYAAAPDLLRDLGAADGELDALLRSLSTVELMNELRRDPRRAEDPGMVERARLLYRASVRTADDFLGEVLRALDRSGRAERTIVVVLSDHGEELFERGAIGHAHQLHEELVHVPLVVRAPGVPPSRIPDVVSIVDVAPTLRALCGLRPPAEGAGFSAVQDGRSLLPLLAGDRLGDRLALSHGSRPEGGGERVFRSLRGRRSKFLRTEGEEGRLYDLVDDPGETRDLAGARPDDARRSAAALDTLVRGLSALRRDAGTANLTPELKAGLEALGYLGGKEK